MPNYTFENKKTKKEFILTMKMDELEPYLKENPDVQQIFTGMPGFASSWNLSGTSGKIVNRKKEFNQVLKKIHKNTAGSVLNKTTEQV
jgi:hypothetical protein